MNHAHSYAYSSEWRDVPGTPGIRVVRCHCGALQIEAWHGHPTDYLERTEWVTLMDETNAPHLFQGE